MQQTFKFQGSVTAGPPVGNPSGQPAVLTSFDETVAMEQTYSVNFQLTADAAYAVSLGPLASGFNHITIQVVGGKVKAAFTSSDGTAQAIPVDPSLILRSDSVDITALTLTRTANIDTDVYITAGKRAT